MLKQQLLLLLASLLAAMAGLGNSQTPATALLIRIGRPRTEEIRDEDSASAIYFPAEPKQGYYSTERSPPVVPQGQLEFASPQTPVANAPVDHGNSINGHSGAATVPPIDRRPSNNYYFHHYTGRGRDPQDANRNSIANAGHPVIDFAWSVFSNARTASRHGNLVLSPLLLQSTLALLRTAAVNETALQLGRVINQMRPEQLHELNRKSVALSMMSGSTNRLGLASAIFADQTFDLSQSFVNEARAQDIGVSTVNFRNVDYTTELINNWIANATANKVLNMFRADQIREQGVLLTNALYFKGVWRNEFNETHAGRFHVDRGLQKDAMFMRTEQLLRIKEFETAGGEQGLWVEIPYQGHEFSMILIVPAARFELDRLIHDMSGADINDMFGQLSLSYRRMVDLQMPKFEIQTSFSLVNTLLKMGLTDLFTLNSQLPHMTNNHQPVKIDDILQKAVLKVDETGSEAAVVQSVSVVTLSLNEPPLRMKMIVDQPFVAMIVDTVNKVPLFIAKIIDP